MTDHPTPWVFSGSDIIPIIRDLHGRLVKTSQAVSAHNALADENERMTQLLNRIIDANRILMTNKHDDNSLGQAMMELASAIASARDAGKEVGDAE